MDVMIKETSDKTYPITGRYFLAGMQCGNHSAQVVIAPTYVQVIVQNASNRAWRGMGKRFATVDAAVANYKTAEVRAMIQTAASLAA